MVKKLAIICVAVILFSCAGTGSARRIPRYPATPDNFLLTVPRSTGITIIGVSGSLLRQEDEINTAREDAARKVAMYYGVKANYEAVHSTGSSFLAFASESNFDIEYDENLELYMDRLTFDPDRDVTTKDSVVFVRFTYPASFPGNINYSPSRGLNGRPDWVDNPPRHVGGYIAGVGFTAKQFRRQDTYIKSYKEALFQIVTLMSVDFSTREVSTGDRGISSTINMQSIAALKNFLILDIWTDPANQAVWTLAIARTAD